MFALVFLIIAALLVLLSLLGVALGSVNLVTLAFLFVICAFIADRLPAGRYNRSV